MHEAYDGFPPDEVPGKILFEHSAYGHVLGSWIPSKGAYMAVDVNPVAEAVMHLPFLDDEEKSKVTGWIKLS